VTARAVRAAGALPLCLLLWASFAAAAPELRAQSVSELQRQIDESRERLEQMRAERDRLRAQLSEAREGASDVSVELANVERQLSASRAVLAELELQLGAVTAQSGATTEALVSTEDRLKYAEARMRRRLRSTYQLGPLHTARVLLSSNSIADLLARTRYLARIAAWDRAVVEQVSALQETLRTQSTTLERQRRELSELQSSRNDEITALRRVERERQSTLDELRSRESEVQSRLERIEADEARLTGLVTELERLRVEAERARAAAGGTVLPTTLADADAGTLDWPTQGDLLYRFGLERRPDGLTMRWNGVGIAAAPGTPVQAVRDGTVVLAGPFQGYGPTVVLSHGSGYYTLYLYLQELSVVEGRTVRAGEQVGTVGGVETPEGPHIEFQIRTPAADGSPVARDPLEWLRARER
jgi:septal ring factor EnvC (AmiA/AmiB activator)